jgi:hypothetical protein
VGIWILQRIAVAEEAQKVSRLFEFNSLQQPVWSEPDPLARFSMPKTWRRLYSPASVLQKTFLAADYCSSVIEDAAC